MPEGSVRPSPLLENISRSVSPKPSTRIGSNADVASTARISRTYTTQGAIGACATSSQSIARCVAIDTESEAATDRGADARPAGSARPKGAAGLAGTGVERAGAICTGSCWALCPLVLHREYG